jgi:hypothetical protein
MHEPQAEKKAKGKLRERKGGKQGKGSGGFGLVEP